MTVYMVMLMVEVTVSVDCELDSMHNRLTGKLPCIPGRENVDGVNSRHAYEGLFD